MADATLIHEASNDTSWWRIYRKPDGHEWIESESRLEEPEYYYQLRRASEPPKMHCNMLGIWAEG